MGSNHIQTSTHPKTPSIPNPRRREQKDFQEDGPEMKRSEKKKVGRALRKIFVRNVWSFGMVSRWEWWKDRTKPWGLQNPENPGVSGWTERPSGMGLFHP